MSEGCLYIPIYQDWHFLGIFSSALARMVLGGPRWCQMVLSGIRWCHVVQGGAMPGDPRCLKMKQYFHSCPRWCQVVQGGVIALTN